MAKTIEHTIEQLEETKGLSALSTTVQNAVKTLLGSESKIGKKITEALGGSWLGHPLHPILTDVAIGGFTVAWVLDILAEMNDDDDYRNSADHAMAVGLIGASGTILTGLNDWTYAKGRARKLGLLHAITNATGNALYLGAYLTRKKNRPLRFWLSMTGATVITVGSYLGGTLVYKEGMGVEKEKKPARRTPRPKTVRAKRVRKSRAVVT